MKRLVLISLALCLVLTTQAVAQRVTITSVVPIGSPLSTSFFGATTSAQLAGVLSNETGTDAAVFANTPTLVTPNIGAATGVSLVLTDSLSTTNVATLNTGPAANNTIGGNLAFNRTDNNAIVSGPNNFHLIIRPTGTGNIVLADQLGNVTIAGASPGTNAVGVLVMGPATAPSTSPADTVQSYECDVAGAGTGGLCIRDEGGTILKAGNGVFHVGANPGLTNTVTVCSSGACVTTCTMTFTGGLFTTKGANCG